MQEYFRVSPPSVHQMVLTLERAGFLRILGITALMQRNPPKKILMTAVHAERRADVFSGECAARMVNNYTTHSFAKWAVSCMRAERSHDGIVVEVIAAMPGGDRGLI
jgi:hypothetical protein